MLGEERKLRHNCELGDMRVIPAEQAGDAACKFISVGTIDGDWIRRQTRGIIRQTKKINY